MSDAQVMLVDDEEFIREAVEIYFQTKEMKILCVPGGEECLRHLEAGFRGVILMDVMMPRMDGWDTIREIVKRGLHGGNAIIMLTALDEPDERMEGLQEYVIDYLTKPFDPQALLDSVTYYLTLLGADAAGHV
ncbi:response regulator [Geobacter pickeringii]|uniref:Histidine kinase n=1 Tax=Geobacter pickeringii TaxID=345632 RepID=A0A0B5BDX0_9BACT|nr:response regulator [Geobacter pickeringii]AJE02271.1 histidine kinase [Geobacter pickeringii]